jgi:hypothetical protein
MKNITFLILIAAVISISGCNNRNAKIEMTPTLELPTPTIITLEEGFGGISGQILNAKLIWPGEDLFVYAAEFYGDIEAGEGTYILETRLFPKAALDPNGFFQLDHMKGQAYVLFVGPTPETSKPILAKDGNDTMIVEVIENEVLILRSLLIDQ